MFTSRAEFRLSLRQDNADRRLTKIGRDIGLVDDARWARFENKMDAIARGRKLLNEIRTPVATLAVLLRRPEVTWESLRLEHSALNEIPADAAMQLEIDQKYEGYVTRQDQEIERNRRLADRRIPTTFNYERLTSLRTEAREKLTRVRPITVAQASRISGITPADIALLMIHLDG
jgi:tRNA uridine 5-carboxymethylaminomethyl modification enzyme